MMSINLSKKFWGIVAAGLLGVGLVWTSLATPEDPESDPRFAEGNELLRPQGYREWIFVGSGLGMSYSEEAHMKTPHFTNVYINLEAYRKFVDTGKFPDKTILVMEAVSAGGKASINKRGQFEDRPIGIEAAVKEVNRFGEKWAYFSFIGASGESLTRAKPFPKEACWSCHNEHGAIDNVFVQFYPVLREARRTAAPRPAAGDKELGHYPTK